MKTTLFNKKTGIPVLALWACIIAIGHAQVIVSPPNYTVTTPTNEYEFVVNGQSSGKPPVDVNTNDSFDFSLNAGATYIFTINTSSDHPVDICTFQNPNSSFHYSGASTQDIFTGNIILTIPATNYPTTLYYICVIHQFYGIITVNPPQPPPSATILQTAVTTNIGLTFSGGTNTIPVTPQFSSNLVNGAWQPVPRYTNTFSGNGTNTTSFDRLDAICGPNVFIRIAQATN